MFDDSPQAPALSTGIPSSLTGMEPMLGSVITVARDKPSRFSVMLRRMGQRLGLANEQKLIKQLEHDSESVRLKAVQALGRFGSEKAVAPLLNVVIHDPYVHPCVGAMRAVVSLADHLPRESVVPAAEQVLLWAAQNRGQHLAIRVYALGALGELGVDSALPLAAECYKGGVLELRVISLVCFMRLNKQYAVEACLQSFDDPAPQMRWAAAYLAGYLRDHRLLAGLERLLDDPYREKINGYTIRSTTYGALIKFRTPQAHAVIRERIRRGAQGPLPR